MAPNRNVVKPEFVPPQIEHGLIEIENSFFCDPRRRRDEFSQAIVNEHSLVFIHPGQQMPQGQRVAFARSGQHDG